VSPSSHPSPKISVVICTYNRCDRLMDTLASLSRMSVPENLPWELVVVDNNSADRTKEVVQSVVRESRLTTRYVFENIPGLSHARNRGVVESAGEIISFLDDDVVVAPDWLSEIWKAFQQYDAACIGGRVLLWGNPTIPSWWDRAFDLAVGKFDRGDGVILDERKATLVGIGANISFRRRVFDKYGLFHTAMGRTGNQLRTGEETELVLRLQRNNELTVYYPGAVVFHNFPSNRFSKRYLRRNSYRVGEWNCLCDSATSQAGPKLLGVPRWMYRAMVEAAASMISKALRGRQTEAFIQERRILMLFGYFMAAQKLRRSETQFGVSSEL
jgi:glucosyl-dolichyl phosphate glucuronosyltransferase